MRIVIAGGGFGGVKAALELAKNPDFQITLISDKDCFLYYPALYGTATGHSHLESSVPLQQLLGRFTNVTLVEDPVVTLDTKARTITGASGKAYAFDELILALGVVTTYFGIKGLDKYSYSIKSLHEIKRFKDHLHKEMTEGPDKNYVVVGAGPTGVELSAAMSSYLRRVAAAHDAPGGKITIDLIEAAPRVLPRMSEAASRMVTKRLEGLGINVMTNRKVNAEAAKYIEVDGEKIPSETVVWTSGVTNNPFFKANANHFDLAPNGRVNVNKYLEAAPNIFVIGDNAVTPYGGLAQTALGDAVFVARNLKRRANKQIRRTYKPKLPPTVVPVGERWAIFEWGKLRFGGIAGAFMRRAADFVGYHDLLPIGQALGVWRAGWVTEEDCEICQSHAKRYYRRMYSD